MTATTANSTALARTTSDALASFNTIARDATSVSKALERAQAMGHLCSPATAISGGLPEGTSVAISAVLVDVERETFPISGSSDRGLSKVALDRLALSMGVSWTESRRLDDRSHPHYCEYLACGSIRQFDGTTLTFSATKSLDYRDKSPAVETLWTRYKEKLAAWERDGKQGAPPRAPDAQIREIRATLAARCETSARLRAVKSLGIRSSYSRQDLAKPFITAKIVFSGESEDPELRREFAIMRAQSFLSARNALYGDPSPRPALPPPMPAPPVEAVHDEDDDALDAELVDAPPPRAAGHEHPSPTTMPPGRDTAPAAFAGEDTDARDQPAPAPAEGRRPRTSAAAPASDARVRFGRDKGKRLADVEDLDWYRGAIAANVADPSKDRWRDDNQAHLDEIDDELARRGDGERDEGPPPDDDIPF